MKVVSPPAIGLAPTVLGTASVGGDWLRELQAAHRLAWFHGPNSRPLAGGAPQALPQSEGRREQQAAPRPAGEAAALRVAGASAWCAPETSPVAFAATGPACSRPMPAVLPGRLATPAAAASQPAPGLGGVVPWAAATARPVATTPARAAPPRPVEPPHPATPGTPVRVHVEEGAQGLVVWLGVDARAASPSLQPAALATELRRQLSGSGLRLATVVCNGTALAPDSHFHQEP